MNFWIRLTCSWKARSRGYRLSTLNTSLQTRLKAEVWSEEHKKTKHVTAMARLRRCLVLSTPPGEDLDRHSPGSHSLTPGSQLCLRIALRQLPLRKSTGTDTEQWGGTPRQEEGPLHNQGHNHKTAVLTKSEISIRNTTVDTMILYRMADFFWIQAVQSTLYKRFYD